MIQIGGGTSGRSTVLLLFVGFLSSALAATARYRQGRLVPIQQDVPESLLATRENISLAQARRFCALEEECVSFGFESPFTRFPAVCEQVFFFRHADWHTGSTMFLEDPSWHLWVNTTREIEAIPVEAQRILEQLDALDCESREKRVVDVPDGSRSLRRSAGKQSDDSSGSGTLELCLEEKVGILDAIYHLVFPKELKATAAPFLIPKMIELTREGVHGDIRQSAATNLIVIADSVETAPLLVSGGVYEEMAAIVRREAPRDSAEWDFNGMPILALDVIANIVMHRSANSMLQRKGAHVFLRNIMETTGGFPALQSTLALLHMDAEKQVLHFPEATIEELIQLLRNTIDGDVVYGILWDLIPGPLSGLQVLVEQRSLGLPTIDSLVEAGLVEELLRILEEKSVAASHANAALGVLQRLALLSEEAREMIFLAAHSIYDAQKVLEEYQQPAQLAQQLASTLAKPNFVSWSQEL